MMRLSAETSLQERTNFVQTCVDLGLSCFDHADIYGSYQNELLFGKILKASPILKAQTQHITKCGIQLISPQRPDTWIKHYDLSHQHIIQSAERSLNLLGIEKLDVLLIHRPSPLMNIDEVAGAFEKLKSSGKVLHFGVSNFTLQQIDYLQSALSMPLIANQIQGSLAHLAPIQDGSLEGLALRNLEVLFWSPLGGGKLLAHPVWEVLSGLSLHYGCSPTQLALAWLFKLPTNPKLVLGSMNLQRLQEAVAAQNISIDLQHWFQILRAATGKEVA